MAPILINPPQTFVIDPRNLDLQDFYLLGEIFDFNNDTYEITFEDVPHFLIYTEAQGMFTYDLASMT